MYYMWYISKRTCYFQVAHKHYQIQELKVHNCCKTLAEKKKANHHLRNNRHVFHYSETIKEKYILPISRVNHNVLKYQFFLLF